MPQVAINVLYHHPTDPAVFEKYYADVHVPLVTKHAREIGFTRAELVKFTAALDGSRPAFYRKAELWFDSDEALRRGIATPGFAAVAGDLAKFASGGLTGMISVETSG